ncbi:MAG: amino acid permease [Solirubrobacteraceae bacterium]
MVRGVENVVWFPTVLSFVAAAVAYVVEPRLANEQVYLVIVMLAVFWGLTLLNFFGEKWIMRMNNPAVIIGTLIPAAVLIALGGESAGAADGPLLEYLATLEAVDKRFPGFEHDIHGVQRGADGNYAIECLTREPAGARSNGSQRAGHEHPEEAGTGAPALAR